MPSASPRSTPSRSGRRLQRSDVAEQPDLEIERAVDNRSVRREPAVGDAENELRAHHPLDVYAVDELLHRRQHLSGEFHLAEPERAAPALAARPAEEKAHELPQRVEAEAARHHRVALEMARKKPEIRLYLELGAGKAFAVIATFGGDFADPLEHQHRG